LHFVFNWLIPKGDPERELDLICFGDDGGFVNVISLSSRFFIDNAGDTEPACFTPADLLKHSQDFGEKTIQMMRVRRASSNLNYGVPPDSIANDVFFV
jgi:hypothetical protein